MVRHLFFIPRVISFSLCNRVQFSCVYLQIIWENPWKFEGKCLQEKKKFRIKKTCIERLCSKWTQIHLFFLSFLLFLLPLQYTRAVMAVSYHDPKHSPMYYQVHFKHLITVDTKKWMNRWLNRWIDGRISGSRERMSQKSLQGWGI